MAKSVKIKALKSLALAGGGTKSAGDVFEIDSKRAQALISAGLCVAVAVKKQRASRKQQGEQRG